MTEKPQVGESSVSALPSDGTGQRSLPDTMAHQSIFFTGGGEMGERMRAHDWARTPLGPPETWPLTLLSMVSSVLNSPMLGAVLWGPDLIMLYNDAYIPSMLDRHPHALGRPVADVWGETWELVAPPFRQVMTTGKGFAQNDVELPIVRSGKRETTYWDFTATPIRGEGGHILGLLNQGVEITQRRLAGEALKSAELHLREQNVNLEQQVNERTVERDLLFGIVEATDTMIMACGLDYTILAINKANADEFERIYGVRPKVGDNMLTLLNDQPEHQAQVRAGWGRGLAGEEVTVIEDYGDPARIRPYYEVRFRILRNEHGERVGCYQFVIDVTERLREQAQLAQTQEALRQSQKMEAVGQLTGGVAHDFNNLLTVVRSSVDLLKRPDLSEDRRGRYVAAISDTVDRAAKLTGQLLAFARRQALKPEVFAVCESVRMLGEMMKTLAGSRVNIVTDLPEQPCFVNADPSQFDTALVNMAVNARDAMNGEGQLTITVQPAEEMPAIRLHAPAREDFVVVSITDTGCGIPPEGLERIFEPFFTTKAQGKGTGLGLSQVYGFAKQSGGDIAVTSEVGVGTTFALYLPRVAEEARPAEDKALVPLADGHGTCVLVVEDNEAVGSFTKDALIELGYRTVLAGSAEEALTELTRDADRFDVVFSDVVMPGMSGIELGQRIRREHHDLPVVLTSGYSHVLAQNGTFGFELLHKPYSIEQLSRVLRKAATWQRRKRILNG